MIDVVREAGDFTILLEGLQTVGLLDRLEDLDLSWTLFAPTDAAFLRMFEDYSVVGLDELAGTLGVGLQTLLLYHASGGLIPLEAGRFVTRADVVAFVVMDGEAVFINSSEVVGSGSPVDNGIVHVLDYPLAPLDLAGFLEYSPEHTLFGRAIAVALGRLGDVVVGEAGEAMRTLFAPTDTAFLQFLEEQNMEEEDLYECTDLENLLWYHIVEERWLAVDLLDADGRSIEMANGEAADVVLGETVTVSGATVSLLDRDVHTIEGIVHFVRSVMVPPSFVGCGE